MGLLAAFGGGHKNRRRARREERMATWTVEKRLRRARGTLRTATCTASLALAFGAAAPTWAQHAHDPGVNCVPAAQRAGRELDCWITGREVLGELRQAPFWHLD